MDPIGQTTWVIPAAHMPARQPGQPGRLPRYPAPASGEGAYVLNAGPDDATLRITIYFAHRPPTGPCAAVVPGQSLRFVDLTTLDGTRDVLTPGVEFSAVVQSDVPVVVEHAHREHPAEGAVLTQSAPAYAESVDAHR